MEIPLRICKCVILGALAVLIPGTAVWAEVKVVIDHNREAVAAAAFKFKHVPSPAKNDAASTAKFTLVDGLCDGNNSDLSVLHDGKVPNMQDQPGKNFFFGPGQDGGRVAIDLDRAIEVKQVNTYSWHPTTRGPQVYKLYAADGSARGFDVRPKKGTDPVKCGWNLVVTVDTRPKSGTGGGQYGVSIFDDAARAIGTYRYLLFDICPTEKDDPFGNTFYSEIDVVDAAGPKVLEAVAAAIPAISKSPQSARCEISIDYTESPDLKEWVEKKLQPTADKWYPKIIEALPSTNFKAPLRVSITITDDFRGVAATFSGERVLCNRQWLTANRDGESVGAVVHELVHVVQHYGSGPGSKPNPVWLVEGIADYIRWFQYEPVPSGTRPHNTDQASYTDSYRTTAGFLNFLVKTHDQEIVAKLNVAMRQGKYSDILWKEYTGNTVDELWKEYVASLKK